LEDYLKILFPNNIFIRNRIIKESGIKNRPDFFCKELKLIVEFNGPKHYTDSLTQSRDSLKKIIYNNMGYKIINIPYFIQMCPELCKILGSEIEIKQIFPHGFINEGVVLPSDFNSLGIKNFYNDLLINYSKEICNEIYISLFRKYTDNEKNILKILPLNLIYVFSEENKKFYEKINNISLNNEQDIFLYFNSLKIVEYFKDYNSEKILKYLFENLN
jgi:hypothetical protein